MKILKFFKTRTIMRFVNLWKLRLFGNLKVGEIRKFLKFENFSNLKLFENKNIRKFGDFTIPKSENRRKSNWEIFYSKIENFSLY